MTSLNAPVEQMANSLQPIRPDERIYELDVLRGFALFGVLIAYTVWNLGGPGEETYGFVDRILNRILPILIDTKFYTLFAILFGLGFAIQLGRAAARGVNIVPTYCRRLLVLLLIGLLHALLLRNGDILVPYAVMGFILIPLRNASNKVLLLVAIIALIYPYVARFIWEITGIPYPERPVTDNDNYLSANAAWVRYWYSTAIVSWPASLPMFVFGLFLGRQQFFHNFKRRLRSLRLVLGIGLATGIGAFVLRDVLFATWQNTTHTVVQNTTLGLLWSIHAWGIAIFYASALLLILQIPFWRGGLRPLSDIGRMALTNYLLQAIIIVPVCLVFGLFDKVSPGLGILLAIGVAAFQIAFSRTWMRRHDFGPVEWVWRYLTYRRLQQQNRLIDRGVAKS